MILLTLLFIAGVHGQDRSCVEFEKDGFSCVPYYLCKNNAVVTDGAGVITIRTTRRSREEEAADSSCPTITGVCCKVGPGLREEEEEEEYEDIYNSEESLEDIYSEIFEQPDSNNLTSRIQASQFTQLHPKCGIRNIDGLGPEDGFNPVDGAETDQTESQNGSKFGEWPHVCMLLEVKGNSQDIVAFRAGASLIDTDIVLTGATKVYEDISTPEIFIVRCGEWDAKQSKNPRDYQQRLVKRIIFHPNFDKESVRNNFAILFLESEFKLEKHITPVCLPRPGKVYPEGTKCFAHGWGKDRFDGSYQTILKSIELPLVAHEQCQQKLQKTRLTSYFLLHESFLCAGGGLDMADTCVGDGGGPLACLEPGSEDIYVQIGIVSWGIDCGVRDTPGVYSNLPKAVCWIDKEVTCQKGLQESALGFDSDECPENDSIIC
jgi:kallikrein